jgi:hypothetical protein
MKTMEMKTEDDGDEDDDVREDELEVRLDEEELDSSDNGETQSKETTSMILPCTSDALHTPNPVAPASGSEPSTVRQSTHCSSPE